MKSVRIGSGSAYWGDALDLAVDLAERGNVSYIGFDHLAELTMAILQRMKMKDPRKGYIEDIIPYMRALLPIAQKKGIKLITNAGGANPESAADEVIKLAKDMGFSNLKIGVILGDDVYGKLDEMRAKGVKFRNLDTGEEDIERIKDKIVAANVYIGAERIIDALKEGADLVVAGRVSDNALYVGPLMYEFGWDYTEPYWDRIGAAITVGHIIECSCCCTGGMSNMWKQASELWKVGFPIAEVYENGEAIITKTPSSGGIVNEWTIKEHLVYEVHDPSNYMMPDGIADLTSIKLEEISRDQVKITNMTGKPRPNELKLCIGYEDGWIGEGLLIFPWPDALARAKKAEEIIRNRFKVVGLEAEEIQIDYIGVNTLHREAAPVPDYDMNEVGLRVAVKTRTREHAEKVRREATHLWTMGPVGTAFGVPFRPRQVISLWPTLIPREEVPTTLIMKEVK